jgi:hypothetical protein
MNFVSNLILRFVPVVIGLFLLYLIRTFVRGKDSIIISIDKRLSGSSDYNKYTIDDEFFTIKRCDEISPFLKLEYVSFLTKLLDIGNGVLVWGDYIGRTEDMRFEAFAKHSYEFMLKEGFFSWEIGREHLLKGKEIFQKFGLIPIQSISGLTGLVREFHRKDVRLVIDKLSVFKVRYDENTGLLLAYELLDGLELMRI